MTDFASLIQADKGQPAHLIHLVDAEHYDAWLKDQSEARRTLLSAHKFSGKSGQMVILPAHKPDEWDIVAGVSDTAKLSSFSLAKLAENLPSGTFRLAKGDAGAAIFGWMTAQHIFTRYKADEDARGPRILLTAKPAAVAAIAAQAAATCLVRDLVNTPAEDMGPEALESESSKIAEIHSASLTVTRGDSLKNGYPLIHAVGRAADRKHAPRLIELEWGDEKAPRIALIGKGVCFDSGGLDIKPSAGMRLMKKDMGGAAHALGLARLIMELRLPVRLHLLIPAVENAISGDAMRPGDIVKSRQGLTVEIDNTDAEGRLVLADAFTKAGEAKPELMIDFATLTGAARVALGPDLPALFSNDDALAAALMHASKEQDDPIWQLPLHDGYGEMLASSIADTMNSANGFGGAITAALFLKKFVPNDVQWAHLDTYAWRQTNRPGRPKGGDALGLRAVWQMLSERYSASD